MIALVQKSSLDYLHLLAGMWVLPRFNGFLWMGKQLW